MKLISEHKTKDTIQNHSDIDRIDTFKLLNVYVFSDLSWNNPVTFIYKRANSRLHFLWQKQYIQTSQNFLYMLAVAMAWAYCDDSAICYVVPGFWGWRYFLHNVTNRGTGRWHIIYHDSPGGDGQSVLADGPVYVCMCMFVGLLCADQQNELTLDASRNVIDMFSVSSLSSWFFDKCTE